MDVSEIKKEKALVEKKVANLINDFSKRCEVRVTDVVYDASDINYIDGVTHTTLHGFYLEVQI